MGKLISFQKAALRSNSNSVERSEVRRKIGEIRTFASNPSTVTKLSEYFRDPSRQVRLAALRVIGPKDLKRAFEEQTFSLIHPLLLDETPRIRKIAAEVMLELDEERAVRALLEKLSQEKNERHSAHLARLIHSARERELFPVLEKAVKDPSKKVRATAINVTRQRFDEGTTLELFHDYLKQHEEALQQPEKMDRIVSMMMLAETQLRLELLEKAGILSNQGKNVLRVMQNTDATKDPATTIARLKLALVKKV